MNESLMAMSLDLLLYGMGVVFLFLVAAIVAISLMSRILNRYFYVDTPLKTSQQAPPPAVDPDIMKAIQLALDKHRGKNRP